MYIILEKFKYKMRLDIQIQNKNVEDLNTILWISVLNTEHLIHNK